MANSCDGSILKQHSLFITDLEVVEDPYRTFNPTGNGGSGSGTPNGIWTFGKFMTNMANTTSTGTTTSDFIRNWLKSYMEEIPLQNVTQVDQTLPRTNKRELILDILIRPWIHKANGEDASDFINSSGEFVITAANWEAKWDNAIDADLIKYAPFKLTAIVNRLDLRNNIAYTNKILRAGETRFIFTAINLIDLEDVSGELATGSVGNIPINNLNINSNVKFLDWQGMNVIFEFGNVQTDLCAIKAFAQAWTNLSTLTLGSSDYNNALEDITETVINANAGLTAGRPNGCALNQLRTNEKIFFNTISNSLNNESDWNNASWQFRQFEIDPNTNQLVLKPLTNTPIVEDYNNSHNVTVNNSGTRPAYLGSHLTSWIYRNQERVRRESHSIPATFTDGGNTYKFLEKTGDVDAEYAFYWDLKYEDVDPIPFFNYSTETVSSNTDNKVNGKDLRFKFSLNTCQGCHNGETKTFFTMVSPLSVGESARYWLNTPDTKAGLIDIRTGGAMEVPYNIGKTVYGNPSTASSSEIFQNYPIPYASSRNYVNVSAFITGRTYDGYSYEDDEERNVTNEPLGPDNSMDGLYFVNDPSNVRDQYNQIGSFFNYFGKNDERHGFNELERRQNDLCNLIQVNCNNNNGFVNIIDIIVNLKFMEVHE